MRRICCQSARLLLEELLLSRIRVSDEVWAEELELAGLLLGKRLLISDEVVGVKQVVSLHLEVQAAALLVQVLRACERVARHEAGFI